jgi:ABC-type transport system involved in cytochrome c biogenesis ATPase subunit
LKNKTGTPSVRWNDCEKQTTPHQVKIYIFMLGHRTTGSKSTAQIFTAWQNIHTHVAMAEFTLYMSLLYYWFIN